MNALDLRFGIPDLQLGCASGSAINPASFAGHELIVAFAPLDPDEAAREIAAYGEYCAEFVRRDAWLLIFAEQCSGVPASAHHFTVIPDAERHAWVAFRDLTPHPEEMDRDSGAAFLFTRGGGLHRYWHGSGHAGDVLAELRVSLFHHQH